MFLTWLCIRLLCDLFLQRKSNLKSKSDAGIYDSGAGIIDSGAGIIESGAIIGSGARIIDGSKIDLRWV